MSARSTRYIAQKVYPLALATAAGAYIYLWVTKPKTKAEHKN